MRLEQYPAEKLKEEVLRIIGKRLDLRTHTVFFFGSRVSGGGGERSDIDVGVEGPEKIPSGIWLDIQEEARDIPTLYEVEMVDFRRVSEKFRRIALRDIEVINKP